MTMLHEVLNWELFTLGGTPVTLGTLVTAAILLLAALIASRLLQNVVRRAAERGQLTPGATAVSRRLVHYVVLLIGIGVALDTVGVQLSTLFAAGAIFAIGLGFAVQNIAQNFMSGVILLVERSIKPGDILEVEGTVVRVVELGIRYTLARTRDSEELIIPNTVLVQSTVKNYTLRDSLYRLRAVVGVLYSSDMEEVERVLKTAADAAEWRHKAREPIVLLTGFGDSAVNFEVSVWVDDPWHARPALSKLHHAIFRALREAGITIAFPQMDVHFDRPFTDSVGGLRVARGG